MRQLFPLLLTALMIPLAHADRAADEASRKEALLRQYSTSEAEARFEEYRRNPDAATQALGSGLSNLANRMYQRGMERQRAEEAAKEERRNLLRAIQAGKQLVPTNAEERDLLLSVLEENWDDPAASRLRAELMLGLRPTSSRVYGNRNMDAEAAALLRAHVYSTRKPEGWAVNLLAKLYLTGRGVPRDEGEAWRLLALCAAGEANHPTEADGVVRARCKLTQAAMTENGWGVDADAKRATALREAAAADYNKAKGTTLSVERVTEVVQP